MTRPAACTRDYDHDAHYLGRDHRGVPQRCEGWSEDLALDGGWERETGFTGR